jgi:hypothetical protein
MSDRRPTPSTGDLDLIVNGEVRELAPPPDLAAEALKERLSTWLSTVAIGLFVTGLVLGCWPHWGAWSLCVGGATLGISVAYADAARAPKPVKLPPTPDKPSPPGPTSAGNLHTKGPGAQR